MRHPTIKDYREKRRSHMIAPLTDHPEFLGQSALDLRWNRYHPKVNLSKKEDLYEMEVTLPGFAKEDIEVLINDNIMTIRAEKKTEVSPESEYLIKEFDSDIVIKRFELGKGIGHEKVTAKFENGILNLTFIDVPPNKELPYKNIKIQ